MNAYGVNASPLVGGILVELCPDYTRSNVPGWPIDESLAMHFPDHKVVIASGATSFYLFREDGTYIAPDKQGDVDDWFIDRFIEYLELNGPKEAIL